jgi:hypothetical protein
MGHLTWGLYTFCGYLAAITSLSGEETRHVQVLFCVRSQFAYCWETMIMCNYVHECVFCAYLYRILSSKDMFFIDLKFGFRFKVNTYNSAFNFK